MSENAKLHVQAKAQSRLQTGAPRRARSSTPPYNPGLQKPAIAALAESALRFFDGQRYALAAWVVMPNHVHLLADVWDTPLSELVKSWKGLVAREANKVLGRSGAFWEREYLDTVIADEAHRQTAVRYIENNPVKAGLAREGKEWPWSSARFRDEFGRLKWSGAESARKGSADVASALGMSKLVMSESKEQTNMSRESSVQSRLQTGTP